MPGSGRGRHGRARWAACAASWCVVIGSVHPVLAAAEDADPAQPTLVFRLQDPSLNESSGLAVSQRDPDVVWTHNDGGTVAQVLALDRRGRTTGIVTLRGIDPFDPEALAPGVDDDGRPLLFLGDIGDNRAVRSEVSVFRFREPRRVATSTVDADWFRFRYPDGPHDAEALLVDPRDNRLWIATKDFLRGGLYRAPRRLSASRPNALVRVADVPGLITDGAFLPDGRFVLRSYASAYVYGAPGELSADAELPAQEQGESLAVDGAELLVGSEGVNAAVYAVPVPEAPRDDVPSTSSATPPVTASASPSSVPSNKPNELPVGGEVVLLGGCVVLGLLAALAATRRRRSLHDEPS